MSIRKKFYISTYCFLLLTVSLTKGVAAEDHRINMKDWLFNPKVLTVHAGETVTWVNEDDTMHNIYFDDNFPEAPQKDEPEKIRVRRKFSLKFEKAGEYNYYCKNHKDYNMVGKIIVRGK